MYLLYTHTHNTELLSYSRPTERGRGFAQFSNFRPVRRVGFTANMLASCNDCFDKFLLVLYKYGHH